MDIQKVHVYSNGMLTPLGANTPMSLAAIRAGICAYTESEHISKNRYPMKMALVPDAALADLTEIDLTPYTLSFYHKRLLEISLSALQEVCQYDTLKTKVPLFLAGPDPSWNATMALDKNFLKALHTISGVEFDIDNSRLIHRGRVGGLEAVELAFKFMQSSQQDFVLVGGVDSYKDYRLLGILDAQDRILTSDSEDGFVPGEAACFIMLMSDKAAQRLNKQTLPYMFRPGLGKEDGHRYSDKTYQGDGLDAAFKTALSKNSDKNIDVVYSSFNGEHYWAKEYGVSMIRNQAYFTENVTVEHPADCIGDIGAAFGPMLISLMSQSEKGQYLGYCSSDHNARAAVRMQVV